MTNIYAALEIGTSRTVLAVGEAETGGRLKISCHANIPSRGIRKSQIIDIASASHSVKSVLKEVEKNQAENGMSLTIGNAFLVVSGQHIKADTYQGTAQIARQKVSDQDIEEVQSAARGMTLPREREVLDIVEQTYTVDNYGGIISPKNKSGRILKLNALYIHGEADRINDARTAMGEAHLELRDPLFACTCAADAVLDDSQKRDGVMVLDLGAGSTGYAIYCDGVLAAAGAIGVGGDHISNDIATAFQTIHSQADELKKREACAIVGDYQGVQSRIKISGLASSVELRTISRHSLNTVVNARCRELISIIRDTLEELDLIHRLNAGVVFTGGGAALDGFAELVSRELGTDVTIGKPKHVDGLEDVPNPEAYAAICGALMYAHRNYEEKSLFKTLFGGFGK